MAWTRTRLEVPAITGDPSVLLAAPPPDGGWTPRLDRTVTPVRWRTSDKKQDSLHFLPLPCGGADAPCEAGTAGPAPHRVVQGSQPTQCNTLGLARGSGPFEPPTGESSPLAPPSPPPFPSPSPMTEASLAREATATRVCGASRPRARRGIASTGSRCAVAPWRSWRRRGRSLAAVRWCFRALGASRSRTRRCRNCSGSCTSRPCRTASGRAFGTGRPKRPITLARWRRLPWRTRSTARSRRPTGVRTCSSGGVGSWMTGPPTWPAEVEGQDRSVDRP